jgi:hypothetical protein
VVNRCRSWRVGGVVVRQHLQRDGVAELFVVGGVDGGERAAAEQRSELVAARQPNGHRLARTQAAATIARPRLTWLRTVTSDTPSSSAISS